MNKNIVILAVITLVLFSCNNSTKTDHEPQTWKEIKQTRSIELYQDFLVENPDTQHFNEAIDSLRIFRERECMETLCDCGTVYRGNRISLLISNRGDMLMNGEFYKNSEIEEKLMKEIIEPADKNFLYKEDMTPDGFYITTFVIKISEEIVSGTYTNIFSRIIGVVNQIRDQKSEDNYGTLFQNLNESEKEDIINQTPMKFVFECFMPPPPSPDDFDNFDDIVNNNISFDD